jgi:signal transduction histidine kinase
MLKKAELQVHKMNRLIQCYLESSAMEAGKISHFPAVFDIQELLKEVISDLHLLYPGYILFLKPGPSLQVYADREKIAQVLQNLVSNAIKYSARIDVITVHFKKVENCLQVAVEDHGTGIKAADHEKIFDRFYRVDDENGKAVKGYGIGLYLSKEIIKQHNGEIWLKSEVNKGSKFYFTLPLS